jgi:hypothetical protein
MANLGGGQCTRLRGKTKSHFGSDMSVMNSISSQTCQLALAQQIAMTKASDAELPTTSQLPTTAVGMTMHGKNLQMWVKHTALLWAGNKIRKNCHMILIGLVFPYVQSEVAMMCC